jgi:hypothetical protein
MRILYNQLDIINITDLSDIDDTGLCIFNPIANTLGIYREVADSLVTVTYNIETYLGKNI